MQGYPHMIRKPIWTGRFRNCRSISGIHRSAAKKLKQARGRQRRRIKDALHKQSTTIVREHPDTSFALEDMKGIRKSGEDKGKRFRTYLNRWPYAVKR